jgi:hypothetical protein
MQPVMFKYANGDKDWRLGKTLHRDDGPALEYANGNKSWHQHGKYHRDDGPAIEYANGNKSWYLHDKKLSFDKWLDVVDMSNEDKVMMKLKYG